jgi:hypothetical protein
MADGQRRRVADIFVSFTKSDQQWAHWIAQELKALHHEAHVHDWEIGPSEDIVGWMEKRHDEADYVLCVVSPDYLNEDKAPFSTWERRAALWRMVKSRKGHVLLFVVKPVRLPSLVDHFRRCLPRRPQGGGGATAYRRLFACARSA